MKKIKLIERCKHLLEQFVRRFHPKRKVSDNYLKGYRRLAYTGDKIEKNKCWCCRHAVAYVTWWCELDKCEWQPCYNINELNKRDYRAGCKWVGGWTGLPPGLNT